MRSRVSSLFIFASCVSCFDRAYYRAFVWPHVMYTLVCFLYRGEQNLTVLHVSYVKYVRLRLPVGNDTSFPARRRAPASVNHGSLAGTNRANGFASAAAPAVAFALVWVNTCTDDASDAGGLLTRGKTEKKATPGSGQGHGRSKGSTIRMTDAVAADSRQHTAHSSSK